MRRRDVPKALLASTAGAAILAPNVQAQVGCAVPCYAPTPFETPATVVIDESYLPGNVKRYGATGDGVTNDGPALQAALNACTSGGYTLYLPKGVYKTTQQLSKPVGFTCPNIVGDGYLYTAIDASAQALAGLAALYIRGGSGQPCGATIQGIDFIGSSSSYGIEVDGQNGVIIRQCRFSANAVGLRLHNKNAGNFTEYVVAEECVFQSVCSQALQYVRSGGAESFHGSGLRNCIVNTSLTASEVVIDIGAGCLVYNAPLSLQIFVVGPGATLVQNNEATYNQTFHGHITVEPPAGTLTVAAGHDIYFSGGLSSLGQRVVMGTLVLNQVQIQNNDGTVSFIGRREQKKYRMSNGSNTTLFRTNECEIVQVSLQAANYDHRYVLILTHDGFGRAGAVSQIAFTNNENGAGYGAPAFSLSSSGDFKVTNANYPVSSDPANARVVTAYISRQQLGPKQPSAGFISW